MVKFIRGLAASYNATTHADGIYFATDTKDIILNGVHYGAGDLTDDLQGINDKIGTVAAGDDLASLIAANASAIATLNGNSSTSGSVDSKVATAIANIINGAPEAFDTLQEIAAWIGNGDVQNTTAATMLADINTLKSEVGTVPSGSNLVDMIAAAQTAATYDDTALAARVSANESAIASNTSAIGTNASAIETLAGRVTTNEGAITTLNGASNVAGSVDYKINAALSWIEA